MSFYFTADEHYGHANIIKFCNRPFDNVHEMNKELVYQHNSIVSSKDTIIHAGDFTLNKGQYAIKYINLLNGHHIFLVGSHDRWLKKYPEISGGYIFEMKINKTPVTICHYAMRTWPKSHYNSWQLYGHSHGGLPPIGKQLDIGVDNAYKLYGAYRPFSENDIIKIMNESPNNPNFISKNAKSL